MLNEESCVRITRLAKKRAAAMCLDDQDSKPTKRIALGELPNLANAVLKVNMNSQLPTKLRGKSKKIIATREPSFVSDDVDADVDPKTDDPQMCGDYISHIHYHLRKLEMELWKRPLPNFLQKVQTDVTANMRGILVDWLVDVAEEYQLLPETLHLAVLYIDRYLSLHSLSRKKLQLLGVSSMLIASKYEQIKPPKVEDFSYITDHTFSKKEIVKMEADILKALKFELGGPTVITFLREFSRIAQETYKNQKLQLEFLGSYLAELSLLDYQCVKFLPSLVAASAIFLARFIIRPKMSPWNAALQNCSEYKPSDLKECVISIHDLYLSRRGAGLHSVREKYKQHKYKAVAAMASPPEVPSNFFEDI